MTYEEQRAEAKRLYEIEQPGGVWEADDVWVRDHYMRLARGPGFLATLNADQKKRAREYRGDDTHGMPTAQKMTGACQMMRKELDKNGAYTEGATYVHKRRTYAELRIAYMEAVLERDEARNAIRLIVTDEMVERFVQYMLDVVRGDYARIVEAGRVFLLDEDSNTAFDVKKALEAALTTQMQTLPASGSPPVPDESRIDE